MSKIITVLAAIIVIVLVVMLGLFLIQLAWGWVIPDIFSGAVEAGLITPKLTIIQACKILLSLGLLGLTNVDFGFSNKK